METGSFKFQKIIKWSFYLLVFALLQACQSQDINYFRLHPQALFKAVESCERGIINAKVSCEQIKKLALSFGELAVSLRQDPQLFGQTIMDLQIQCAKQEPVQQYNAACQDKLAMHLAVVKWFESPEK